MTEQIEEKVEGIVVELAKNLTGNALYGIPIAGIFLNAVFNTILSQFESEVDKLREDLGNEINAAIESYAGDVLADDLMGLRDRLKSYKDNGELPDELKRLNEALEGEEASFFGTANVAPLKWLPLTLGFTFLRAAVWQRIEANKDVRNDVKIEIQVQDFVIRAFPLIVHLVQKAVERRLSTIQLRRETERFYSYWVLYDGNVEISRHDGNYSDVDPNKEKVAEGSRHEYMDKIEKELREELVDKYLKPLVDLANTYQVHLATITNRKDLSSSSGPLADQYADTKQVMRGDGDFVTGMQLYKHHNNVASELISRSFDRNSERLVGEAILVRDDSHGATSSHNLSDQYADFDTVICPPGRAVVGISLYKHDNNLALKLWCKSLNGEEEAEPIYKPELNKTSPRLYNQFIDLKPVNSPQDHVVIG
ncbi:MAG: hypothetical protein OEN23_00960 [Paracoccaceae bacterium]|nr:hypothetical protein [Paracoccaceae bacterium]